MALSFRAAGIYEQKLNQPARAFRSYERVLSVEPKNARAASALVPIYQGDEKWARLASMYEVLLDTTGVDDKARSLELLEKLRELSATKLHDRPAAFRWALRAISSNPMRWRSRRRSNARRRLEGAGGEFVAALDARAADASESERARLRDKSAEVKRIIRSAHRRCESRAISRRSKRRRTRRGSASIDSMRRSAARASGRARPKIVRSPPREQRRRRASPTARMSRYLKTRSPSWTPRRDGIERSSRSTLMIARRSKRSRASTASRWEELAALLDRRKSLAEGDTRAELAHELGKLQLEKLSLADAAIESFKEALALVLDHAASLAALETLLRSDTHRVTAARILEPEFEATAQPQKLAWALQILLDASKDSAERKQLALRLADAFGERLHPCRGLPSSCARSSP